MYWTLELASKLEDAPWPATKDELIDYAMRSGAPLEVIENLQEMEDEGEIYESIEDIWPLVFLWGKLVSEYWHFPDKSHRDAVGVVIFLSPGYGFGGKVVGAAHIREEKVQVAFHGIELDSSQIAP